MLLGRHRSTTVRRVDADAPCRLRQGVQQQAVQRHEPVAGEDRLGVPLDRGDARAAQCHHRVVRLVHGIRTDRELLKPPGVAETLDWARALHELGTRELDTATAAATLGVAVKYREDAERVRRALDVMLTR